MSARSITRSRSSPRKGPRHEHPDRPDPRRARKIHEAQAELDEASVVRAEERDALFKAQAVLEELLEEVENPGSRYPLLDRPTIEPAAPPARPRSRRCKKLIANPPPEPAPLRVRKHRAVRRDLDA